jgi:hypothetical protein
MNVVMHPRHGALVSWLERTGTGAEVRLRPVSPDGRADNSVSVVEAAASRAGGFPRMAALNDGTVLMTWTEAGEAGRQVRVARLRLP